MVVSKHSGGALTLGIPGRGGPARGPPPSVFLSRRNDAPGRLEITRVVTLDGKLLLSPGGLTVRARMATADGGLPARGAATAMTVGGRLARGALTPGGGKGSLTLSERRQMPLTPGPKAGKTLRCSPPRGAHHEEACAAYRAKWRVLAAPAGAACCPQPS